MADSPVEILLNDLKDLLLYRSHLITDTKEQIENLYDDLRLFPSFLRDLQQKQKRKMDEGTNALAGNIRDVVYEVEDVIEDIVTQAFERKSSKLFKFWKSPVNLHEISEKVQQIKKNVERNMFEFAIAGNSVHEEDNDEKIKFRPKRNKEAVGFEDVKEELIHRLTLETEYLDVICVTGMLGLGKTTLAWKIFNHPTILYEFRVRIWLSISQEFSDKDIFLAILEEFTTITDDIRKKKDNEIAQMALAYLEAESFLIVLDDVWSCADWDRVRDALPDHHNKGKILMTTRIKKVGKYACYRRPPHQLRFFTEEESWELLRLEALHKLDCPPELEATGRLIAKECEGLPLAVEIIGGILATKYWEWDLSKTIREWKKVSTNVNSYIMEDPKHRMNSFISLSYDKLPYHLRLCFLYFGMFPEDYEIPVSKLVCMWIGEGFIQQGNESTLEKAGEKYLEDLIDGQLVQVEKINYDGKVKTCRIRSTFREFCQTKAGSEYGNFLREMKFVDHDFSPPISDIDKYRRLCIHSHFPEFISSKPFCPHVRSFISIREKEFTLSDENVTQILKAFKFLRVFDVKPLKFPKLTKDLFQLVHVRYIALSLNLTTLPSKFDQLWNLQTLIIDTTSRTLEVKADIWKLIQLRHFKTNASATLVKPSKHSKHGAELQKLGTISPESCTSELSLQACNLKKLGIRGQLALLLEGKIGSFDSLGKMKHLENLKLINDVFPLLPLQVRLPEPLEFPYRLKRLTLRGTYLEWSNMATLEKLMNLKVLKLKDNAFTGKRWEVDRGCQRLQVLHIETTDLAVWDASSQHYPSLKGLVLRNCEKLLAVPTGLASIESFQALELYKCKSAVNSAKDIQEAKKRQTLHSNSLSFLLLIDPSILTGGTYRVAVWCV